MHVSRRTATKLLVLAALTVAAADGRAVAQNPAADSTGLTVPRVPRFPLGRMADGIRKWERLHPTCSGTSLRDIRPCMQSFVDYGSMLGLVTLVDRRGLPLQVDGVGAFKENSIVQIQSMTKPFVAVLVLKLVEQGRIASVDSRVIELPGFADFPYSTITIRQLLTHSGGIWYRKEPSPGVRTGIAPQLTNALEKQPGVTVRDKSLDFVARHYANAQLYPLEQTGPQYSNISYTLLGWIVERLSGVSLDRYMHQVILDPLALHDTFFFPARATREQQARIVSLDRRLPDPADYVHYDRLRPGWVYPSPEGGLYSTAADLRRFLQLFRHAGMVPGSPRVLSHASIALLLKDQPAGQWQAPRVAASWACHGQNGRTLGFYLTGQQGCVDSPNFSPGTVSHTGRFATEFWYDPQKDEIGMFLAQVVLENPIYSASVAERDVFKQMLARITER